MTADLAGKIALVTGASTGIGAAVAHGFARAGADVAVHYNASESKALAVVAGLEAEGVRAAAFQADLAERGTAERLVAAVIDRFERIDILVNNAGTMVGRRSAEEVDDAYFDAVIGANLYSTVACCRAVLPGMKAQRHGSIVNVSSQAARSGGMGGATLYASAKAAVATYTRGLAREVARAGIRVNAISPGVVLTPFHERFTPPETMTAAVAAIPLGRAASADEVVGSVLFLVSDVMSGYVTGQVLEINGGTFSP